MSQYSCFKSGTDGLPEEATIKVQDGWTFDGRRKMRPYRIKHLSVICGHAEKNTDPECVGCFRRDLIEDTP